ncbi:choloylglycine hydrolase family protein [Lactobacillus terrae]|uniref:choloylglycine hydrolase family protein n=1 Tax=Lactobacillus terrae TaxID=2269374 RepID=UPI000C1B750F|nr:choloylglycine hydrolase family protein [Lactobacillus terrae]
MCTSLSYEALDGTKFLARTMDFAFELNGKPTFLPRGYNWLSSLDNKTYNSSYAILGTGAKYGHNYMVADGFNEHGLACAELYFDHEAVYEAAPEEGKINLVSEEFILWVLGHNKSIAELRKNLEDVRIIDSDAGVMGANQPLHWIVTDRSGATYVIEPRGQGLELEEDKVGVMTNTPDYQWHKTNLSNYLGVQTTNFQGMRFGNQEVEKLGQNGTFRLPGGFTAVDRFVRESFVHEVVQKPNTASEAVNTIMHMFDTVRIPKGVNVKDNNTISYTQYEAVLDITNCVMYYTPYSNRTVYKIELTPEMINSGIEPKEFSVDFEQQVKSLN